MIKNPNEVEAVNAHMYLVSLSLLPALAVSDVMSLTVLPNKCLLAFLGCLWRKTHASFSYQHIKITGIIYCDFVSIDKAKLEFSFYGQRLMYFLLMLVHLVVLSSWQACACHTSTKLKT